MPKFSLKKGLSFFVLLAIVFVFGERFGASITSSTRANNGIPLRLGSGDYKFINPLLTCESSEVKSSSVYQPLDSSVSKYIKDAESSGKITSAGVYFRDPDGGRWMGVNPTSEFDAASLYKVPIIIAFLKLAESDPGVLRQSIYFDGKAKSADVGDDSIHPFKLAANRSYTVEQLLNYLGMYSDNDSKNLLLKEIDQNYLTEVFSDLDIPLFEKSPYTISPKNYSLFFRVLYNATYLNREMSEKALKILSKSDFKDGLVAGVPNTIAVSHKFGEHRTYDNSKNLTAVELHDCGIIYNPGKPYILCVMTKGKNSADLKSVIKDISGIVYDDLKAK